MCVHGHHVLLPRFFQDTVTLNLCACLIGPKHLKTSVITAFWSGRLRISGTLQRFFFSDPYDVKLESETRTSDYVLGVLMVSNDDGQTFGAVTDCFGYPTWNDNATEYVK